MVVIPGGSVQTIHFKPQFTAALGLATAVYPAARIEIAEAGVILMPSKPPVNPKVAQIR